MESFNTFNLGDKVISNLGIIGKIDRFWVPAGAEEEYISVILDSNGLLYHAPTKIWSLYKDGLKSDLLVVDEFHVPEKESPIQFHYGDKLVSIISGVVGIFDELMLTGDGEYLIVQTDKGPYCHPKWAWRLYVSADKSARECCNEFKPEFMNKPFNVPLCVQCNNPRVEGSKYCERCIDIKRSWYKSKLNMKGENEMCTFDLLIIPKDRVEQNKVVSGITSYGLSENGNVFWFIKNGFKSFVPVDNVKFFGREFDYKEKADV